MKTKRLISFSPSALDWLKRESSKLDISVSEYLRRLVDAERTKKLEKRP